MPYGPPHYSIDRRNQREFPGEGRSQTKSDDKNKAKSEAPSSGNQRVQLKMRVRFPSR